MSEQGWAAAASPTTVEQQVPEGDLDWEIAGPDTVTWGDIDPCVEGTASEGGLGADTASVGWAAAGATPIARERGAAAREHGGAAAPEHGGAAAREPGGAAARERGAVAPGAGRPGEAAGSAESRRPRPGWPTAEKRGNPARLALGLAVLAADRLRATGGGDALATGIGLVEKTAGQALDLARRLSQPPRDAADWAASLPGAGDRLRRPRKLIDRALADVRRRGRETVAASRVDARSFLRGGVDDGLTWAQSHAIPQLIDSLVPHLVEEVVPRIIEGSLPEIRARVLPVVIDDLKHDPEVRELILARSRGNRS